MANIKEDKLMDKLPRCGECGGEVKLEKMQKPLRELSEEESFGSFCNCPRKRQIFKGVWVEIPNDFEIPTCIKCGEESMNLEISEKLDAILVNNLRKNIKKGL